MVLLQSAIPAVRRRERVAHQPLSGPQERWQESWALCVHDCVHNCFHFHCKFPPREVAGLSGCYKASHCAARSGAVTADATAIFQTTVMLQLGPSLLAQAAREQTVTSAAYQLAQAAHEATEIIWPGYYDCYKASHRATRHEHSTTGANAVLQTANPNLQH